MYIIVFSLVCNYLKMRVAWFLSLQNEPFSGVGPLMFLVFSAATVGEGDARGVQLVAICNRNASSPQNPRHWTFKVSMKWHLESI